VRDAVAGDVIYTALRDDQRLSRGHRGGEIDGSDFEKQVAA